MNLRFSVFIAIIYTYFVERRPILLKLNSKEPYSSSKSRNKISSLFVYVLLKTRNVVFSRRSRAKTAKKCTNKKAGYTCKVVDLLILNLLVFLDVLVAVASLNLKVPNNQSMRERCWLGQRGHFFPK